MTWDQLRHFHKQPEMVALWGRCGGPLLQWMTPGRRRLLLAAGALWVAIRQPLREARKTGEWLAIAPGILSILVVIALGFAFAWLCYQGAQRFSAWPKVSGGWTRTARRRLR